MTKDEKKAAKRQRKAQLYACGLLGEEGGEIAQISGKVTRFGIKAKRRDGATIQDLYHEEVGDVIAAGRYAVLCGLLDADKIEARAQAKLAKLLDPASRTNEGKRLAPPVS